MASKVYSRDFFFVASNEHAAEVIGSNGWKVKTIAIKTGTQIKCPSPEDPPIFSIYGPKSNVETAKKMIQSWANHFDVMKSKKRTISLDPGEEIKTAMFTSLDVACIIGKKGKQVKKIACLADVKIISPDINKEPVFIISGKHENIDLAIYWMKLTTFSCTGSNYFTNDEAEKINLILKDDCDNQKSATTKSTEKIIDLKRLRASFNLYLGDFCQSQDQIVLKKFGSYNCCYCSQKKTKVAKAFCGHVISCDLCIVDLFQNIHLKCYFCKVKIENFLIEIYSFI